MSTSTTEIKKEDGWTSLAEASGADRDLLFSSKSDIEYAISSTQPVDLTGHKIGDDIYSITVPDGYTIWIKTDRNAAEIVTTEF